MSAIYYLYDTAGWRSRTFTDDATAIADAKLTGAVICVLDGDTLYSLPEREPLPAQAPPPPFRGATMKVEPISSMEAR